MAIVQKFDTLLFPQKLGGVSFFKSDCKLRRKMKIEMHAHHLGQWSTIKSLGWGKWLSYIICISL